MFDSWQHNNFIFSVLLSGCVALLILISLDLGRRLPSMPESIVQQPSSSLAVEVPVEQIGPLFSRETWESVVGGPYGSNPFFTQHFQPPPPPEQTPEPPPPPPPTSKKIPLLYQGFFETAGGKKRAFIQAEEKLRIVEVGEKVTDYFTLMEIDSDKVVLKNLEAGTNVLNFNVTKELEVPIK